MSVDVKDHRRYAEGKLAESVKAAEERLAAQTLLVQEESILADTGDEKLDKMIRVVQDALTKVELHLLDVATQSIHLVQAEQTLAAKCEYFYSKGRRDAYKEVSQIPARIIAEAKPVLHSV